MSTLHLSDTVFVRRCVADVFDYVADFRRATEWRSEVVESTMTPAGPLRLGSVLREVAVIAGRRVRTESVVDGYEEQYRFTFRHRSGPLPVRGGYTVTRAAGGAVLRYDLAVELSGGWGLLAPIFRVTGPRTLAASLDELRFRLEAVISNRSVLPVAS